MTNDLATALESTTAAHYQIEHDWAVLGAALAASAVRSHHPTATGLMVCGNEEETYLTVALSWEAPNGVGIWHDAAGNQHHLDDAAEDTCSYALSHLADTNRNHWEPLVTPDGADWRFVLDIDRAITAGTAWLTRTAQDA